MSTNLKGNEPLVRDIEHYYYIDKKLVAKHDILITARSIITLLASGGRSYAEAELILKQAIELLGTSTISPSLHAGDAGYLQGFGLDELGQDLTGNAERERTEFGKNA